MKSFKIIIAIVSIATLTGVASADVIFSKKGNSKEVKEVQVDLISMTDKKGMSLPTQG